MKQFSELLGSIAVLLGSIVVFLSIIIWITNENTKEDVIIGLLTGISLILLSKE